MDELKKKADDMANGIIEDDFDGLSYSQGVLAAMAWLLGETNRNPMEPY